VRYDGTGKHALELVAVLRERFELRGFCPEVAIGLGVPRETIELIASDGGDIRCVGTVTVELDVSERLSASVDTQLALFAQLSGYLVKARSPSCGLDSTPFYSAGPPGQRTPIGHDSGLFTAALRKRFPQLPIAQEDTLADPLALDRFMAQTEQYYRQHIER
jgi:uncharacterized protein YbbK (DUF523 family)